ncbi:MAG: hypothetical protein H0T42_13835 [Deltaproteobacteria bacterium]|nr:hypothetical protein [Deltaproteobacteria bacterium]
MRFLPFAILALAPATVISCAAEDDAEDLGSVADGKTDAPAIQDRAITVPKRSAPSKPGVRNYVVRSTVAFEASIKQDTANEVRIIITNEDTGVKFESTRTTLPKVTATGDGTEYEYKIRVENWGTTTLRAKLSALGQQAVSPALLAAARANLDRIDREIDKSHLDNYGLTGSRTDQFMSALAKEYEHQHPDQYIARVKALASMVFFALPDVAPPTDGVTTPFHGLDMTQFGTLMSIEDQVFNQLVQNNDNDTNGVRPFSVCETKFIIEKYVRPGVAFPGFDPYKAAYTTAAASCTQREKAEWYNFRGLGGLRPSWVESNLADRFLRRMAKNCKSPTSAWAAECATWETDRLGYRQLRNRQLAARTMFYAPGQESYLIDPDNATVLVEDRNGDGVGEFLRPGPVTLLNGDTGTLQVNSTGEFTGNLKFQPMGGALRTITPAQIKAEDAVDPRWDVQLLDDPDMGLMSVFSDGGTCTGQLLDPAQCPLMRRFYSMIDRHENFYRTYSGLSPDYYGVSSQPSPLVACSITLTAAHHWDTAGTPSGGTAGFIFLMRIPFKDILTGNDRSVSTIMPGPQTTSLQDIYAGTAVLDMSKAWLDIASLSNNLYQTEHEISAFGAVRAEQIEGILVIRKPAAVP